jgi:hypothetical protein
VTGGRGAAATDRRGARYGAFFIGGACSTRACTGEAVTVMVVQRTSKSAALLSVAT